MLTTGGGGIAFAWPFTEERFFAPVRPLPVAPLGLHMLSLRGLYVLAVEAFWFLPCFVYALWPRRKTFTGTARISGRHPRAE
jgi:inner membrane protein